MTQSTYLEANYERAKFRLTGCSNDSETNKLFCFSYRQTVWVYGVGLGIALLTIIPIQVYSFVKFLLFMFAALSAAC